MLHDGIEVHCTFNLNELLDGDESFVHSVDHAFREDLGIPLLHVTLLVGT